METEKSFGYIVKVLREERNLTLREVAFYLRIDTSMLGKIEKNKRRPTKQIIEKFSKFFNVEERELNIAFLSDNLAYQILAEEDIANEVLNVAEKKFIYLKATKNLK